MAPKYLLTSRTLVRCIGHAFCHNLYGIMYNGIQ